MARNLQPCHGQPGECFWDANSAYSRQHRRDYYRAPAPPLGGKRRIAPPNFFRGPPTSVQGTRPVLLQMMDTL